MHEFILPKYGITTRSVRNRDKITQYIKQRLKKEKKKIPFYCGVL